MWSGSTTDIPNGWKLCDGTNGTPNLKDKFIVGAGGKYSVGNTGGADSVTLSVDQMPSHTHDITDNGHKHTTNIYSQTGRSDNANDRNVRVPDNVIIESSTNKTGISINPKGGGQAHENRPPYYALCFIMKVAI
jgi:microcystin-dependent protein